MSNSSKNSVVVTDNATVTIVNVNGNGGGGPNNSSSTWPGTIQQGTAQADAAFDLTLDSNNNIFVTGYSRGNLKENAHQGNGDIILVKYNESGSLQWTQQLGTGGDDWAWGVATDNSGNAYITGSSQGSLDGNSHAGADDFFLAKYDSSGNKQWVRLIGTSSTDFGRGLATDGSGNIYATGFTRGDFDNHTHGGGSSCWYGNCSNMILIKYNSDGDKQWSKQISTDGEHEGKDVSVDSAGNVYVVGYTTGSFTNFSNAGEADYFIIKYDSSGTEQWVRQNGTSGGDSAMGVTVDGSDIFLIGHTNSSIVGTSAGGWDSFLVKYNSSGVQQWITQFGTNNHELVYSGVTSDSKGNIYVTGKILGSWDGYTTKDDIFIAKFDKKGVEQWKKQYGAGSTDASITDEGFSIIADSSDNLYATGFTAGNLDNNTSLGSYDYFIMKIDSSSGNLL